MEIRRKPRDKERRHNDGGRLLGRPDWRCARAIQLQRRRINHLHVHRLVPDEVLQDSGIHLRRGQKPGHVGHKRRVHSRQRQRGQALHHQASGNESRRKRHLRVRRLPRHDRLRAGFAQAGLPIQPQHPQRRLSRTAGTDSRDRGRLHEPCRRTSVAMRRGARPVRRQPLLRGRLLRIRHGTEAHRL